MKHLYQWMYGRESKSTYQAYTHKEANHAAC